MFIDKLRGIFSFAGRRRRATHIPLYLFYIFAIAIWSSAFPFRPSIIELVIFFAGYFIILILAIGNHVRRLHDLGHSGWWILLFLIPIGNVLFLFYLILFKGENGANIYGPDPITGSNEIILKYDTPSESSQIKEDNFLDENPDDALRKYKSKLSKDKLR